MGSLTVAAAACDMIAIINPPATDDGNWGLGVSIQSLISLAWGL
jgi:hypothetical protein